MKKFVLATVALTSMAAAAPALAADLGYRAPYYQKVPAYAAPIYNWTGFYIGGHLGGAFAGDNSLQGSDARFLGGVQGGFDYQFAPNWVAGVEAHEAGLASGGRDNGAPGERPYHPGYYGAFLFDPDDSRRSQGGHAKNLCRGNSGASVQFQLVQERVTRQCISAWNDGYAGVVKHFQQPQHGWECLFVGSLFAFRHRQRAG